MRTCTNGQIRDQFLGIGCPTSGSAADIHEHISKTFDDLGLTDVFKSKLVGFCSDGASNMQGNLCFLQKINYYLDKYM